MCVTGERARNKIYDKEEGVYDNQSKSCGGVSVGCWLGCGG